MTEVVLRDLETGDAGWIVQRHGALYAEHDGFDATFEPLVAEILMEYIRSRDPRRERAWIALADGKRVGSVFCVAGDGGWAKLRLFLVEPDMRGTGLAQRMLTACLDYAKARGYPGLRLWTHASHAAACALYRKNGLACVASKPVQSFGQALIEQTWEIAFD